MPRTSSSNNDVLRELAAARDEARVKLHLLSLEARDRWHEVEAKIDAFEHGLDRKGEAIGGWANSAARDLTELIRAFVRAHQVDGEGLSMPVSAIMTREVRTCSPSDSLNHAAQILWEKNTGAIPVVGPGGALMGILTDRDICMAAYTQGRSLNDASVEGAMSKDVHRCREQDSLAQALGLMATKQVRRLPVVDASGALVGLVSLADVARFVAGLKRGRDSASTLLAATFTRTTGADWPTASGNGEH